MKKIHRMRGNGRHTFCGRSLALGTIECGDNITCNSCRKHLGLVRLPDKPPVLHIRRDEYYTKCGLFHKTNLYRTPMTPYNCRVTCLNCRRVLDAHA